MARGVELGDAIALVTGAGRGIGAELARGLAARGVGTLWLVDRDPRGIEALARELGPRARPLIADLSTTEGCAAVVAAAPRVDVLVNNAGLLRPGLFDVMATDDLAGQQAMVDVNCRAPLLLTGAWLPGMIARQRGWILNVGSVNGDFVSPLTAVYGASKAFIRGFTESIGIEARSAGVAVHLLAPGMVRTAMFTTVDELGFPQPAALTIDPARCAREGLDGLFAGRARTTPKLVVRLVFGLLSRAPMWLVRLFAGPAATRFRRQLTSSESSAGRA